MDSGLLGWLEAVKLCKQSLCDKVSFVSLVVLVELESVIHSHLIEGCEGRSEVSVDLCFEWSEAARGSSSHLQDHPADILAAVLKDFNLGIGLKLEVSASCVLHRHDENAVGHAFDVLSCVEQICILKHSNSQHLLALLCCKKHNFDSHCVFFVHAKN